MNQQDACTRAAAISFRQLRVFETIGRVKSVRQAADECNVSQPAVTQALFRLEELAGVALVDRSSSGSYLNRYGTMFAGRVQRFFTQAEAALLDLGFVATRAEGRVMFNRLTRSQVRALIAIVERGSFAEAADSLQLTQQSMHKSMRDLEGNIRKTVCYRTAAGTLVSHAGTELARRMKLAQQEIEWGIKDLDAEHGRSDAQISVGAKSFGGSMILVSVLEDFLKLHPNADMRITHGNSAEMNPRLRSGDVDCVLGLLARQPAPDFVAEAIARTPYIVVGRRRHPLLSRPRITVDDLRQYPWVVGAPGSSRRTCFESIFGGDPPPMPLATCSLTVIRHLLETTDRLTLMTSYELEHERAHLEAIPFNAVGPAPAIGITTRANWMPTKLHLDFMAVVRKHMVYSLMRGSIREVGQDNPPTSRMLA
ncbi:LysR family transcriptional regulator [Novosphingobium flavum]|uniref:LysR family transcriptional regulator n=1 Tax=Novosphingobium flavum TaxID=1778672 RepID=A0A7X1FQX6_9SPHN|nr:LysR family transcriptional regulator [Novosphingobium flavum]MBC2665303.1 LysR family transcriptional regulator [Novosphingobium flavum]